MRSRPPNEFQRWRLREFECAPLVPNPWAVLIPIVITKHRYVEVNHPYYCLDRKCKQTHPKPKLHVTKTNAISPTKLYCAKVFIVITSSGFRSRTTLTTQRPTTDSSPRSLIHIVAIAQCNVEDDVLCELTRWYGMLRQISRIGVLWARR